MADTYNNLVSTMLNSTPEANATTSGSVADYVFIFDTSGSMSTYINQVKNIAANFTSQLTSLGVDYRLGIVEYEGAESISTYNFTNDVGTFTADVTTVADKAYYGGWEEYGLTAIETALSMNFRENATKHFIVITDEGYEEDSSASGTTIANLNSNSVKLDVIGATYYDCIGEWEPVANATGGHFYDINGNFNSIFTSIATGVDLTDFHMQLSRWSYNVSIQNSTDISSSV